MDKAIETVRRHFAGTPAERHYVGVMTRRATVPNARFWVWHLDGWVKLTLKPQRALSTTHGGPTDEGSHWEHETWTHEGDVIRWEWAEDGRDCDGRMSRSGESECPLAHLHGSESPAYPGMMRPEWAHVASSQRDYSAEAAGY